MTVIDKVHPGNQRDPRMASESFNGGVNTVDPDLFQPRGVLQIPLHSFRVQTEIQVNRSEVLRYQGWPRFYTGQVQRLNLWVDRKSVV